MALAPRLTISKPSKITKHRWLILTCNNAEAHLMYDPIRKYVTGPSITLKSKRLLDKSGYQFYIPRIALERLLLTFPYIQIEPALQKFIDRKDPYVEEEVPELEIPGFVGDLWDFQKIGVNHIVNELKKGDAYWLNDGLGLGKTLQALASIAILKPKRVLAIVPNNTKFVVWERLTHKFFPEMTIQVIEAGAKAKVQLRKKAQIKVINYESTWRNPELQDRVWDLVVLDEAHRIKNPLAKQTQFILDIEAKKKLLLTGTPLMNGKFEELWAPLSYCWPEEWGDYTWFEHRYVAERAEYGPIAYDPKYTKELKKFVHAHSIRRRKDQVLKDLPEVVYLERYVKLTPAQQRLYNELKDKLIMWLEDGRKKTIQQTRVKMLRLLQACFSPELYGGDRKSEKINELRTIMEELVKEGEKVIVFSKWSKATKILLREFADYNPAYIDGGVPNKHRPAQIDKFQNDPDCHMFIGTIGSNKEGVTLSKGSYVVFTDLDWVPANMEQAIGRGPAGGLRGVGIDKATIIYLLAADTIEIYQKSVLDGKQAVADMFIERDGGQIISPRIIRSIKEVLDAA